MFLQISTSLLFGGVYLTGKKKLPEALIMADHKRKSTMAIQYMSQEVCKLVVTYL